MGKREDNMRKYGCVLVSFVFLFCLLAAALSAYGQETKVIRLKYASFYPTASSPHVLLEQWCREVEKRTNGRVKISFFGGGTLAPIPQSYDVATRGIADISVTCPQWMAGRFPMTDVLYLPLGVKSDYQATKMTDAWFKKFKPKEYDDVKVLYFYSTALGAIMTLRPLPSINDLKNVKIKVTGRTAPIVSALDAVPVSAVLSEIYESLMMGVAEGAILPMDALKIYRLGELVKGLQINPGMSYPSGMVVFMNKAKWNSLPPDIQKTIEAVSEEWVERTANQQKDETKKAIEYGVSKGMKVFEISPPEIETTKKKVKPILDEYAKRMKEKGLPGEASLNFCLEYIKSH
jgi:TRAP-type C4-dicarboxylate transport system substrate-binding protein